MPWYFYAIWFSCLCMVAVTIGQLVFFPA